MPGLRTETLLRKWSSGMWKPLSSHVLATAHLWRIRFYLLSPATSYAGEYTWQGDAKSGCERILKDVGIAKDEWQMGMTKAFIKNPETVSKPTFSRSSDAYISTTVIFLAFRT